MSARLKPKIDGVLKSYDPNIFRDLADFPEARLQLGLCQDAISSLGTIICKYSFQDVIGINLLHKHFDIADNEVIVRNFDDPRQAYMLPRTAEAALSCAVPYLWAYSRGPRPVGWYPLEFVEWHDEYCADLELLRYADGMLLELGDELCMLELQDVFGIAGLFSRQAFVLGPGETLLETTDEPTRTLNLKVVQENLVSTLDTTQTLWIFSES